MRKWISALALVGALTITGTAGALKLKFPNFEESRTNARMQLNGDASLTGAKQGHRLRLVPAETDQSGSAFTRRKLLRTRRSFKTKFRFEMNDATVGSADGMAFVLTSEAATSLGGIGGGLGYDFDGRSVAVEFDIFGEIEGNHVALHLNGDAGTPVEAAIPPFDLYGGVRWAWIQYAKRSKRLKVFVDDDPTKPGSPLLNERLPLRPALGRKTRAGFTAATGGENAVIEVLSWRLKQKRPRN